MTGKFDPDALFQQIAAAEPEALRNAYLVVPEKGSTYLEGSISRVLLPSFQRSDTDLAVPPGANAAPIDYIGSYITLPEYMEPVSDSRHLIAMAIEHYLKEQSRRDFLIELFALNHTFLNGEESESVLATLRNALKPNARERLDNALKGDHKRQLIARQPILSAMKVVLVSEEPNSPRRLYPPRVAALLLTHAVAALLSRDENENAETLGGLDASLAMELVRNALLYQFDDVYSLMDRQVRLWKYYGSRLSVYRLSKEPAELVVEATGIQVEDFLALGFGLFAHAHLWKPGKPPLLSPDIVSGMSAETKQKFVQLVSQTPEEFKDSLNKVFERWDFLDFERTPVVQMEGGFLVLDELFLLERVTGGLFWDVHDYVKAQYGEKARLKWTQAYGEMTELLVEDQIRSMAPPLLGTGGGSCYYSEEDLVATYSGKRCDAVVYFGGDLLAFEVVSGRLTTASRIYGDVAKFKSDTEKLVIKKARQLDSVVKEILHDETALTGFPPTPGLRVTPIIVVGGGYPTNPTTLAYVDEVLAAEGLFQDPRIEPLSIVDIGELEMLEGLAEIGTSPAETLRGWKTSGISRMPLRNYLLAADHRSSVQRRPSRMKETMDTVFDGIIERLGLRGESAAGG